MKSLFKVFGGQGEEDRRQARKVQRASPELRAEALEERSLLSSSFALFGCGDWAGRRAGPGGASRCFGVPGPVFMLTP